MPQFINDAEPDNEPNEQEEEPFVHRHLELPVEELEDADLFSLHGHVPARRLVRLAAVHVVMVGVNTVPVGAKKIGYVGDDPAGMTAGAAAVTEAATASLAAVMMAEGAAAAVMAAAVAATVSASAASRKVHRRSS